MKFDVAKLKELNELDFEQISVWPREVKIVVNLFVAVAVAVLSYYLLIAPKLPILESAERKEAELKIQFEAKQRIAINLEAYREQLKQLEDDFSSMLRSLPTSNETPGLLDDITLAGTSTGLNFKLLQWQTEIPKEFYTELPIKLEVSGVYHNLGEFTASIARLPRIVTLHDFSLTRDDQALNLQMQAKTYRSSETGNANNIKKTSSTSKGKK